MHGNPVEDVKPWFPAFRTTSSRVSGAVGQNRPLLSSIFLSQTKMFSITPAQSLSSSAPVLNSLISGYVWELHVPLPYGEVCPSRPVAYCQGLSQQLE